MRSEPVWEIDNACDSSPEPHPSTHPLTTTTTACANATPAQPNMSISAVAVVAVSSILLVLSSCEQDLQRTRSLSPRHLSRQSHSRIIRRALSRHCYHHQLAVLRYCAVLPRMARGIVILRRCVFLYRQEAGPPDVIFLFAMPGQTADCDSQRLAPQTSPLRTSLRGRWTVLQGIC